MLNQISIIPFGTDATKVAGYAFSTQRLGNVDLLIENTGPNTLTMKVGEYRNAGPMVGSPTIYPGSPPGTFTQYASGAPGSYLTPYDSGNPASYYTQVVPPFTVVAGGTVNKSLVVNTKQIAFFGSGNTTANISLAFRNPADLRGASFDIVPVGRYGWGFGVGFPVGHYLPDWPALPYDGPRA